MVSPLPLSVRPATVPLPQETIPDVCSHLQMAQLPSSACYKHVSAVHHTGLGALQRQTQTHGDTVDTAPSGAPLGLSHPWILPGASALCIRHTARHTESSAGFSVALFGNGMSSESHPGHVRLLFSFGWALALKRRTRAHAT